MAQLHNLAAAFADCNFHLSLYGAFGAHLLHRAVLALREGRFDKAREQAGHCLLYILLALL